MGLERYGKTTRRAQSLSDMDRIVPWPALMAVVDPLYPKVGEAGGRRPIPLERMLRIYFLQLWFNLSDPAMVEALYDSVAMRESVGIDSGQEGAPDETTVRKFRHLLERHKLGKQLLFTVNGYLARNGIRISNGTIVDATIISAPSSTKNKDGKRDPEMHQTARGKRHGIRVSDDVRPRSPARRTPLARPVPARLQCQHGICRGHVRHVPLELFGVRRAHVPAPGDSLALIEKLESRDDLRIRSGRPGRAQRQRCQRRRVSVASHLGIVRRSVVSWPSPKPVQVPPSVAAL